MDCSGEFGQFIDVFLMIINRTGYGLEISKALAMDNPEVGSDGIMSHALTDGCNFPVSY